MAKLNIKAFGCWPIGTPVTNVRKSKRVEWRVNANGDHQGTPVEVYWATLPDGGRYFFKKHELTLSKWPRPSTRP